VLGKVRKALGHAPGRYPRSLEIGAGTGYFTLNLLAAGIVAEATCTDISPGMLATLSANARRLDLAVKATVADAERLPFEDEQFDLVFGHAVLHHIPDLGTAFAEFRRVLRPGGTILFAGEPSRYGDRIATVPKRAASRVAPLWRLTVGASKAQPGDGDDVDHRLESVVDVHAFSPSELRRWAEAAGLEQVRVGGEELLANWFGWTNRTLEATAAPETVPWAWRQYAYRGYLVLQELDRRLLESRLPPAIFYNLMISARRPGG
jgi:ubiquinone/menaquinone biosynthesis C-methylase UbiE